MAKPDPDDTFRRTGWRHACQSKVRHYRGEPRGRSALTPGMAVVAAPDAKCGVLLERASQQWRPRGKPITDHAQVDPRDRARVEVSAWIASTGSRTALTQLAIGTLSIIQRRGHRNAVICSAACFTLRISLQMLVPQ